MCESLNQFNVTSFIWGWEKELEFPVFFEVPLGVPLFLVYSAWGDLNLEVCCVFLPQSFFQLSEELADIKKKI